MKKNIIDNAIVGHKTVWQERAFLLKIILIPLLVKAICTAVTFKMELDMFHLRYFLVMLPSYILDGWVLAHFLRLLLLGEKQVTFPIKNPAIKATILFSVLAIMVQGGIVTLIPQAMDTLGLEKITGDWNPNIIEFSSYIAVIALGIWSVRLICLYLPLSISAPLKEFLVDIKGYGTSIYILGSWLTATLPSILVFAVLPSLVVPPQFETIYDLPVSMAVFIVGFRVIADIASLLVLTAAMAYMFSEVLRKYGATPIFKN